MRSETKYRIGTFLRRLVVTFLAAVNTLVMMMAAIMSVTWNQYNALITFSCLTIVFWLLWFVVGRALKAWQRRRNAWKHVQISQV